MYTLLACLLCIASALFLLQRKRHGTRRYPPGPKGDFLIGNARELPSKASWVYYAGLKQKYGEITYLNALGQSIIILNSYQSMHDLLHTRSSIYSDRARVVLGGEMMGWDQSLVFMGHSNRSWQTQRKVFTRHMSKVGVQQYHPAMRHEVHECMTRIFSHPETYESEFRFTATKLIFLATYGVHIDSPDHEFVRLAKDVANRLTRCVAPGTFLVNSLPFLKHVPAWVPGARAFHTEADIGRAQSLELISKPFEFVKTQMAQGKAIPSVTSHVIEEMRNENIGLSELEAKWLGGVMYIGGFDTTTAITMVFILAMNLYPDVQRKAQEEIDRVVGVDRLPEFEDKPDLPYLDCLIKEVLRWHTIVPIGVPHVLTQDDEYKGYFIPKNSIVIANSWGLSKDEDIYEDPTSFRPERFMPTPDGGPGEMDPRSFAFGHGKRLCPGVHFGEATLYIFIATVLATSTISKALDRDGNEITPPLLFTGGLASSPESFLCSITPRSDRIASLLHESTTGGGYTALV